MIYTPWENDLDGKTANHAAQTTQRWVASSWIAALVVILILTTIMFVSKVWVA